LTRWSSAPPPEPGPADHTRGEGPVVIEYADLECPYCAKAHLILKELPITRVFRHFPVTSKHPRARVLAAAAEAAGLQGKFWEMHKMIFDHQKDWKDSFDSRPTFEGYAKEIGLDVERYKRDLESDAIAQRIFLDGKRGYSLGVKGTPTLFLNDREVPFETLIQADKLRVVIQKEIESARK